MKPRIVSLFAGIGGFDLGFEMAGFQTVGQVELDRSCRTVLEARFPDVETRIYDVRHATGLNLPDCDVLTFGFPCQDLSVAGARAGLAGERSGLFYQAMRIAGELRPPYIIFENVPGLLSSNSGLDWIAVLEEIANHGYIPDVNILDAQDFGVPQRRKRIFAVCTRAEILLQQRTPTSFVTLLHLVLEVLLTFLIEARSQCAIELHASIARGGLCADGLISRMTLFGITSRKDWNGLAESFAETLQWCLSDSSHLDCRCVGPQNGDCIQTGISPSENRSPESEKSIGSILKLWSELWDESFGLRNSSTTSTALKTITESKIYTCAEISGLICSLTGHLKSCCQTYLEAAWFASLAEQAFINYARFAANELFTERADVRSYGDYVIRSEQRRTLFAREHLGAKCCAEILSLASGLSWYPPPRREAGATVAVALAASSGGDCGKDAGQRNWIAHSLCGHAAKGGDPTTDNYVTAALTGDPYCDRAGEESNLVAFQTRIARNGRGQPSETCPALNGSDAGETSDMRPCVTTRRGVRRLTPLECSRLQGFPDDWLDGLGLSDSTKYRQLGNAVNVRVSEWIAKRLIERLTTPEAVPAKKRVAEDGRK